MPEDIRVGSLELRFLCSKHDTDGGLDMFEMTCPPDGRMPVPHYHRDWDETIYGLSGVVTFTVDGKIVEIGPGDTVFIRRRDAYVSSALAATPCCSASASSASASCSPAWRRRG